MEFREINQLLSRKPLPLEMGIRRLPSGVLSVASRSDMVGCKGRMLDWWFGFMDSPEHYKWWHPQDHKGMRWDGKWSRGSYIGATCTVDESLSGSEQVYRLHIKFHAPEDIFPAAELKRAYDENNVSAFVCATIGLGDEPHMDAKGNMIGGRVIHAAYDTPSGCFLRNRFWLGAGIDAPPEVIERNTPDQLGINLMSHANIEYTILARFLPSLYAGDDHPGPANPVSAWLQQTHNPSDAQ
jgi:hypothetical protein